MFKNHVTQKLFCKKFGETERNCKCFYYSLHNLNGKNAFLSKKYIYSVNIIHQQQVEINNSFWYLILLLFNFSHSWLNHFGSTIFIRSLNTTMLMYLKINWPQTQCSSLYYKKRTVTFEIWQCECQNVLDKNHCISLLNRRDCLKHNLQNLKRLQHWQVTCQKYI